MKIACQWFALCTNLTDKAAPHPVLDYVPCCERCATRFDMDPATMIDILPEDHSHECRECGSEIPCKEDPCGWPGGNSGCGCEVTDTDLDGFEEPADPHADAWHGFDN